MKKRIRFRFTFDTVKFSKLPRFSFDRSYIANFRLWTFDWLWFGSWIHYEASSLTEPCDDNAKDCANVSNV